MEVRTKISQTNVGRNEETIIGQVKTILRLVTEVSPHYVEVNFQSDYIDAPDRQLSDLQNLKFPNFLTCNFFSLRKTLNDIPSAHAIQAIQE